MAAILVTSAGRTGALRQLRLYALIGLLGLVAALVTTQGSAVGQLTVGFSGAQLSASRTADYSRDSNREPTQFTLVVPNAAPGQESISLQQIEATTPLTPLREAAIRPGGESAAPEAQPSAR